LCCLSLISILSCSGQAPSSRVETTEKKTEIAKAPAKPAGQPYATLETDKGKIVIRLLPEIAPKTVENFENLAKSGFYYNTKFHRVMPGAMIQGGDPNTKDNDPYNDGQGNSGAFIPAEFSKRKFERGVVAMARHEGDPNSASCQFFIVLKRTSHWDNQYTIFGQVTEGLEVAERISKAKLSKDPRLRSWPIENIRIKMARIEYR
jgi:peptidyl-prolyl cis-trans isomerase B (cyclophilin B)